MPESGLVIPRVERPWSVEIDSRARVDAAHGHHMERRLLHSLATLQGVVQRLGNKGADAEAADLGGAAHLLGELVVKARSQFS